MARRKNQQTEQGRQWELDPGAHIWIYLRHSPGDVQTIDSQKHAMQEWAAKCGWIVDHTWIDEGIEGSKEEREQFQAMMSHAKQQPRPVDGIAVWSFSRFARDQLDSQFYKADLRKRGYVVTSKIDDVPNNELAPVFEAVIDWKNQRFLDDLSADVKRGQLYLVERGYLPGSHPPPGYTTQSEAIGHRRSGSVRSASRVIKDPELTERVALAWRMKLYENASYAAIHEAVHLFPNRHDYYYFFNNLLYAGIYVFSGKRYPADWQQGARFCEPYVTLEEYYQVQENRRQRTIQTIAPRSLSSNYLLTSILYCAHCAALGLPSAMAGAQQAGHRQTYYRCLSRQTGRSKDCTTPYTPCYKIDDLVINSLKQIVLTPEYVGGEIEKANARLSSRTSDMHTQLRQAEQQVKESERNVEVLLKLIQKKGLTDLIERQYDEANKGWLDATARLTALRSSSAQTQVKLIEHDAVWRCLHDLVNILDTGTISQKQSLVQRFVERVDVFPDRVNIAFRFKLESLTELSQLSPLTPSTTYMLNPLGESPDVAGCHIIL